MPQLVNSVDQRLANGQISLRGNTHDQKSFPEQNDVLHGVDEVGEKDDIQWIEKFAENVGQEEDKKRQIAYGQGYQGLMKCRRLQSWISEDEYGQHISNYSKYAKARNGHVFKNKCCTLGQQGFNQYATLNFY